MFNLENQNKEQQRTNAKTPEHPSSKILRIREMQTENIQCSRFQCKITRLSYK